MRVQIKSMHINHILKKSKLHAFHSLKLDFFQAEISAKLVFAHALALLVKERNGTLWMFYLLQQLVSFQVHPLIFDKFFQNVWLDLLRAMPSSVSSASYHQYFFPVQTRHSFLPCHLLIWMYSKILIEQSFLLPHEDKWDESLSDIFNCLGILKELTCVAVFRKSYHHG